MTCLVADSLAGHSTALYPLTVRVLDGTSLAGTPTSAPTHGDTSASSATAAPSSSAPETTADSRSRARSAAAPCSRCGGPKPTGRGRRFCDECVRGDAPRPVMVRVKPCHNCGSTAPKPRGHKVCAECAPIVHEAAVARKKARDAMKVLPCADCGRARRRGTGQGTIYCAPCMEKRAQRPRCSVCRERPIRGRAKQLCEECHREAIVRRREYHRLAARRREAAKKKSRVRYPDQQGSRMRYRLDRERDGATLEPAAPILKAGRASDHGQRADSDLFPNLPSAPLAALIDGLIAREVAGSYIKGGHLLITGESGKVMPLESAPRDGALSPTEAICEWLGITSKTLREWRQGVRTSARFDTADRIVTRAEACWWEIWPGDPLAEFAFTGERAA
jgi:hypothetical protein